MTYPRQETIAITTAADGSATVNSDSYRGRVIAIIYTKTDFATGVDFAITGADTGQNIWTESNVDASKTVAPRQATHDVAGAAALYAAVGQPVLDYIYLAGEAVEFAVTNGGNAKTGAFVLIIG